MPTGWIVKDTALEITKGKATDVEKVRAVYDWVLANTYRDPKVRGCGIGDIKAMLETKSFGGKCGDINALFVGLVGPSVFPRAISTASASRRRPSATSRSGRRRQRSRRSTVGPRSS